MAAYNEVLANCPSDIENQDFTDIRDILGSFVSKKASSDTTIGEDRSVLTSFVDEQESSSRCTEVGQSLASIADEIDLAHGDIIFQEILGKVGTPQLAFKTFQSVAKKYFPWDSTGGRVVKVTWHRIAALLGFCYSLCRQFLLNVDNRRALKAFFTAVVGYLARFLFERQLLSWVHSQGGWTSVLHLPNMPPLSWMMLTGIGLSVVAGVSLFVYNRLTT